MRLAIAALQREASEATRKRVPFPRVESDYFPEPGAIDQVELLKAIERRIAQDPRVDAYIKFQLLSAVDKFDEANARAAITAYVAAPGLIPLPGLAQRDLQVWNQRATQAKKEDVERLNEEWTKQLEPYIAANEPIVKYREMLKERITVNDATRPTLMQARLEDLSQRAAAGLEPERELTSLVGEMTAWSITASRGASANMADFVREYAKRVGPVTNDTCFWSEARNVAYWRTRKVQLSEKRLENVLATLDTAAQRTGG